MRELFNGWMGDAQNERHRDIVKGLWRLLFAGLIGVVLIFVILSFTRLPSVAELENPKSNEASLILAESGDILGKYYTENRVPVSYGELSPYLVKALVATEDERYYEHSGIDFKGVVRAVFFLGKRGGASTITQQLAKQLFTGAASETDNILERVIQKLKEWIIAVRLERKYTKEEIIALYLNRYDFINGAQGIRAASEIYFNKSPKELALQEAALLIGMLKNASLYDPLRRPDRTLQRRSVVLKQMVKNGYLSEAEYTQARELPLGLQFTRQTHIDGLAPYMRMELAKDIREILSKPEYYKADGSKYDIYRDGLRIYTTINPIMQRIAEEEMVKHMAKLQRTFFSHWKGRDPWTYRSGSSTEVPVERREQEFIRYLRASDRYQRLRAEYLAEVLSAIGAETGLEFHEDDREIDRLMKEKAASGYLTQLVQQKIISAGLAAQYRRTLDSELFPALERKWAELKKAVNEEFREPRKMRIFAYNNNMYADTTMSPLDSLKYLSMFLQTGIMAVEPTTGYVRAWVGGVNHEWFQYDHVNSGTRRQVGSTFKPFVYATAIALQGLTPCFEIIDLPITISPGDGQFNLSQSWTPQNADGGYSGRSYTMFEGLRHSKNTVSVYLMKELGSVEPVRTLVDQLGIDKNILPASPSICLGSVDLSVEEMTGAYTAFANNGIYNRPTVLLRIEDRFGNTIYEALPEEKQALNPQANYVMVRMLEYAATNMGKIQGPVGGKTGTTNDYADGWFMGVTPNLVVGSWVGGENRWIAFRSLTYGQGAYMAKPFFRSFIERVQNHPDIAWDKNAAFYRPPGDLGIELNCGAYHSGNTGSDNEFEEGGGAINNTPDFE